MIGGASCRTIDNTRLPDDTAAVVLDIVDTAHLAGRASWLDTELSKGIGSQWTDDFQFNFKRMQCECNDETYA
jgi:hypothetical protein